MRRLRAAVVADEPVPVEGLDRRGPAVRVRAAHRITEASRVTEAHRVTRASRVRPGWMRAQRVAPVAPRAGRAARAQLPRPEAPWRMRPETYAVQNRVCRLG